MGDVRRLGTAAAILAVGIVVGGCSSPEKVSCDVVLGAESTSVTLEIREGAKSVASLDGYTVTFEVFEKSKVRARATGPDQRQIVAVEANVPVLSGSAGTPDGRIRFGCGVDLSATTEPI